MTHAVFDVAAGGDRVSEPMEVTAAVKECDRMGGFAMGYAVAPWPPEPVEARPAPERPRAPAPAPAPKSWGPDGPGLFD